MLPLACLVNSKYLAIHGGLSPKIPSLDALNKIQRFVEIPEEGALCDLMWSDPIENEEGSFPDNNDKDFIPN